MTYKQDNKRILVSALESRRACFYLFVFSLIFSSCNVNKHLKENEYLLSKNTIKNNGTNIDNNDLEAFIRQKPNRKILKLVRFNLWLYNQVDQQKMLEKKEKRDQKFDRINAKRVEKTNRKNEKRLAKGKSTKIPNLKNKEKPTFRESIMEAGEPPVVLDTFLTKITKNQLQKFVFSKGYFDSEVRDSLVLDSKNKRAKNYYSITKTKPYYVRSINYKIEDPLIEYFILNDTIPRLIKHNTIYDEEVFQKERERITESQLNNGYFYFAPEYVYYLADTNLAGQNVNLTIGVKMYSRNYSETNDSLVYVNHPRFYIENVYVIPENIPDFRGKANDVYMKDTVEYNGLKILHNNRLKFRKKDLTRDISVAPGQLYQQNYSEDTYKGMTSLKVFKSVYIQYIKNTNFSDRLDCYIVCQPVVKQATTIETEYNYTSGNSGIAGSLVFQNKNAFRGAELVELKLKGSITAQKQFNTQQTTTTINDVQNTFNTVQFGPELNIYFPKPLFPFTLFYYKKDVNEKRYFTQPKTILNLSINYQSRPEFDRTISSVSYGFKFTNSKGLFTYDVIPLEAYIVKARLFGNFRSDLLNLNDFFLLNSFQDHITTLSKISATYNNQGFSKKRNLMFLRMSLSSSGNILRGLYSATGQPMDAQGRYLIDGIPFSQFVKIDADYRFYIKVRKMGKLVYRLAGGYGHPLKNLTTLPYEQSFFGGGPNTNRAWRARTLGPGGYMQPDSISARYDKIGNIQIESNIEYRFHIFKSFYGAWFADAGNIWLSYDDPSKPNGKFELDKFYKEIALGSGFGLRYDFSFFVLRLDGGMRVHDPQYAEGKRWVLGTQTLRQSAILNFGIGYPF
ncbi:MAG: outer membrane protein assembly complex, YaeT protein [Bacteroidota bacterium]|nr:outer membrane protein assembly complex, YaeT protein [Bacteroidota bacterium]